MAASIVEQIRRNLVALISLAVAFAALSYNTWRNEVTEDNRNVRAAGFEILLNLGELQQIVFFGHYDRDATQGNPRAGWARVLLLQDLSTIMPPTVGAASDSLATIWADDWPGLGGDDASARRISDAIDGARGATLAALAELD